MKIIKSTDKKPRLRFCWVCNRKLFSNHHTLLDLEDGSIPRVCHKYCAEQEIEAR